jgi:hypothetical protein
MMVVTCRKSIKTSRAGGDIIDGIIQRATGPAISIHETARLTGGFFLIGHCTISIAAAKDRRESREVSGLDI